MMRKTAVLLLLLAMPAWGATYYVSPTGTYGRTPTRDGSAWTDDKALTLAWANDSAVAGDLVRMKVGSYGTDIRPRNSGLPSTAKRITFFGNLDTLAGVVVRNITVDSTDGATQGITVKGVYATGDASFTSRNATTPGQVAGYDTLLSFNVLGSLIIDGRSNVTVQTGNVGDGTVRDYFHFNNGFGTAVARGLFVDSLYVADCTFRLASDTQNPSQNVLYSRSIKSSTIERCRFFLTGSPGSHDFGLNTHYDSNGITWRDCYFEGRHYGLSGPMYLLNLRDNQIGNLWERDTLVEADNSPHTLKVYFQSDGNYLDASIGGNGGASYDFGDSNNTFIDNVVKVRGPVVLDSPIAKYTLHGNVISTADNLKLGNVFTREITFRHNTVFSSGSIALSPDSKLWNSTIAHNIFAVAQPIGGASGGGEGMVSVKCIDTDIQDGTHYLANVILIPAIPGTVGVVDSNLYYSFAQQLPDSFYTIGMSAFEGGGAKQHHNMGSWFHTYGHDGQSHFANPGFTSLSPLTFDPQPSAASLAYSTDLWADDYVGAIPVTGDADAPVVTLIEPSGSHSWAQGEVMTIEWTATDNTAVTSLILDYGYGTSPRTWIPIATPAVGTTSYDWTCPAFTSRTATMRIRALDAVSNSAAATRQFKTSFRTDPETEPLYDDAD